MCPTLVLLKTYGKDIIFNGLVPLFCVFSGAILAYLFQKKAESNRQKNSEFASCTRAVVAISTLYDAILNLRSHIEKERNLEDRHIQLKPLASSFPFVQIDAESLEHILNFQGGGDQLMALLKAQAWVEAAMGTLETRKQVHLDLQRSARPVSESEAIVHPGLAKQLKDLTDGLYEQVDTAVLKIEKASAEFSEFLKINYPDYPSRKIEKVLLTPEKQTP